MRVEVLLGCALAAVASASYPRYQPSYAPTSYNCWAKPQGYGGYGGGYGGETLECSQRGHGYSAPFTCELQSYSPPQVYRPQHRPSYRPSYGPSYKPAPYRAGYAGPYGGPPSYAGPSRFGGPKPGFGAPKSFGGYGGSPQSFGGLGGPKSFGSGFGGPGPQNFGGPSSFGGGFGGGIGGGFGGGFGNGLHRRKKRSYGYAPPSVPCKRHYGAPLQCTQQSYGKSYTCIESSPAPYSPPTYSPPSSYSPSSSYASPSSHPATSHVVGGYGNQVYKPAPTGYPSPSISHGFDPKSGFGGGHSLHGGYGIPFGLKDVVTTAADKDRNANNCKRECFLDRYQKQNCRLKCCNWQCPHVCLTNQCCNVKFPDNAEGQTNDNMVCKADIIANKAKCKFSCYVKMENLDQKKGQYHLSEVFGNFQNAEEKVVQNAFETFSQFYKKPDEYHEKLATSLTTHTGVDEDYYKKK